MSTSSQPTTTTGRREANGDKSNPNHFYGNIVARTAGQIFTTSITTPRDSRPGRLTAFFNKGKRNPNQKNIGLGENPFHPSTSIRFGTTSINNSTGNNHAYLAPSLFSHSCSLTGNSLFASTSGGGRHGFFRSTLAIQNTSVPPMNDETFPPLPKASRPVHRCKHPLDLPELLLYILEFVANNNELYKCLFVNRTWKVCTTKVLWSQAKFSTVEKAALFLSMFDTGATVSGDEKTNEQRVEPLAVLSTGSRSRVQPRSRERSPEAVGSARPIATCRAPSLRRSSARKRKGRYRDLSGPPYLEYAVRMKKLVFYKLKTLGTALLISAAPRLHRLTFLEFYICDLIPTTVVSEFAKNCPNLKEVRVPGCGKVTDETMIHVATYCPKLQHLDIRACSLISDTSIIQVARLCPGLQHINVGRITGGELITYRSISEIATHTKVDTLGLAGCNVSDNTVISIAINRAAGLERISLNNCPRITDVSIETLVKYCPRLAVLEIKECLCISNFELIWRLLQKRVLVEMCPTGKAGLDAYQRAEMAKIKFI